MIKKVALIGASRDSEKFGNIILLDLLHKGFTVCPVNPHGGQIEGLNVYPDVDALPADCELIIFVVPPDIGLQVAQKAIARGFKKLWFQPGAGSREIGELCEKQDGVMLSMNRCIMVDAKSAAELSL